MNRVIDNKKKFEWTGQLKDLIGTNYKEEKSAFIGTIGDRKNILFLVNYDCILVADEPNATWDCKGCDVEVIRFVDVDITIIERDEK